METEHEVVPARAGFDEYTVQVARNAGAIPVSVGPVQGKIKKSSVWNGSSRSDKALLPLERMEAELRTMGYVIVTALAAEECNDPARLSLGPLVSKAGGGDESVFTVKMFVKPLGADARLRATDDYFATDSAIAVKQQQAKGPAKQQLYVRRLAFDGLTPATAAIAAGLVNVTPLLSSATRRHLAESFATALEVVLSILVAHDEGLSQTVLRACREVCARDPGTGDPLRVRVEPRKLSVHTTAQVFLSKLLNEQISGAVIKNITQNVGTFAVSIPEQLLNVEIIQKAISIINEGHLWGVDDTRPIMAGLAADIMPSEGISDSEIAANYCVEDVAAAEAYSREYAKLHSKSPKAVAAMPKGAPYFTRPPPPKPGSTMVQALIGGWCFRALEIIANLEQPTSITCPVVRHLIAVAGAGGDGAPTHAKFSTYVGSLHRAAAVVETISQTMAALSADERREFAAVRVERGAASIYMDVNATNGEELLRRLIRLLVAKLEASPEDEGKVDAARVVVRLTARAPQVVEETMAGIVWRGYKKQLVEGGVSQAVRNLIPGMAYERTSATYDISPERKAARTPAENKALGSLISMLNGCARQSGNAQLGALAPTLEQLTAMEAEEDGQTKLDIATTGTGRRPPPPPPPPAGIVVPPSGEDKSPFAKTVTDALVTAANAVNADAGPMGQVVNDLLVIANETASQREAEVALAVGAKTAELAAQVEKLQRQLTAMTDVLSRMQEVKDDGGPEPDAPAGGSGADDAEGERQTAGVTTPPGSPAGKAGNGGWFEVGRKGKANVEGDVFEFGGITGDMTEEERARAMMRARARGMPSNATPVSPPSARSGTGGLKIGSDGQWSRQGASSSPSSSGSSPNPKAPAWDPTQREKDRRRVHGGYMPNAGPPIRHTAGREHGGRGGRMPARPDDHLKR